jgi:hypothetical protein
MYEIYAKLSISGTLAQFCLIISKNQSIKYLRRSSGPDSNRTLLKYAECEPLQSDLL